MEFYTNAACLLALERLAYGVVWKKPQVVRSLSSLVGRSGNEVELIFGAVRLFKLVQLYVFGTWYYMHFGTDFPSLSVLQFMVGGSVLAFGQILNILVWNKIGIEGVCYGVKFGRNIPWCTEFPFNTFNHPQYLGAILTVWGMFVFCWNEASDWYMIPTIETVLYMSSMYYLEV